MSKLTHRDPNRAALLSRTGSYNQNSLYGSSPQSTLNIPNYGRSYGSESSQIPLSSSLSSFTNHKTAEELESQNDDAILGLSAKITVNIGTEVKESNNILATLNDKFSEATGVLSGTFKKMDRMAKKQYGRWWYCQSSSSISINPKNNNLKMKMIGKLRFVLSVYVTSPRVLISHHCFLDICFHLVVNGDASIHSSPWLSTYIDSDSFFFELLLNSSSPIYT
ncbi:hypothetical protein PSTT_05042 [Puccinia striiformis]|uniref:t-SNARE coiled-coil homology domain-containing protein n=1 Tax=Puccinia striiformis TaxID=27350 RepID=A0A2S4VQI9_9BASI|nr:hypothetical protein PSTT_05042 [Puccinia striiformis]